MNSYNFENLDSKGFEDLSIALGTAFISRGLRPYGDGPDGGREATFKGKMDYPSAISPWDGYLVIQCKHKRTRSTSRKEDADWAIKELNKEMKMYEDAVEPRVIPEYYIFITNVVLSPMSKTGGKDRFIKALEDWATKLNIKGVDVWDRDKITSMLSSNQEIAKRFGSLHADDILHQTALMLLEKAELTSTQRENLITTLSLFLDAELGADQYVRLTQAGYVGDEQTPLARVFVDLQATINDDDEDKFHVVKAVQRVSDRPLKPSLLEQENRQNRTEQKKDVIQENGPAWGDPSRFVFIGGPGQGKSTLAQHLAQRHRAALFNASSFQISGRNTNNILRIIEKGANESGIGLPTHPRFPFRFVLEQFADSLNKKEVSSVFDYIAIIIKKRTGRAFTTNDAEWLLRSYPIFIAFDGLDEVPAVSNRTDVMNAVDIFLNTARLMDVDMLVVATTRPQGYNKEFAPDYFNHLRLTPLSKSEALAYAQKFVDIKYEANKEQRERIMKRLQAAAAEEATAKLMESPLQVTIMAALVDVVGNPPRERYPLFNRYYDIVYQREQERGLLVSDILADYRGIINKLHDHIGLLLQIEAEKAGNAQSRISEERLKELIHAHLVSAGYKGERLISIQNSILYAATHRLVFIIPLEDGRYGFEVRSLQEFAAARALMQGKYDKLKKRTAAVAPVPYWRNTFLFAVGRAFTEENEEHCDMIIQLCRELNSDKSEQALARTLAGSRLALDILTDGVVDRRPKYRDMFLEMALELLTIPYSEPANALAELYTIDDKEIYTESIRKAIATTKPSLSFGIFILLARLTRKDDIKNWANEILKSIWPSKTSDLRPLFKSISKYLTWEEWQINSSEQVARESSPSWVIDALSRESPTKWIQNTSLLSFQLIRRTPQDFNLPIPYKTVPLVIGNDDKSLHYLLPVELPTKEILDEIIKEKPIHAGWLPFTAGYEFILRPSTESLADTLEALSRGGYINLNKKYCLPWPLNAILNSVSNPQDLLNHAQRARKGELGDVQDWIAAEKRWCEVGFKEEDWYAFNDAEWPFTSKIAYTGIAPISMPETANYYNCTPIANSLLKVFTTAPALGTRVNIANSLLFLVKIMPFLFKSNYPKLALKTLLDLAEKTSQLIDPVVLTEAIANDTQFDLVEEADFIDKIGMSTDFYSFTGYAGLSQQRRVVNDEIINKLALLVSRKNPREGILRLLTSLAMNGFKVPSLNLNLEDLTGKSRAYYISIELHSQKPPIWAVNDMTAHIITTLSQEKNDDNEETMAYILRIMDISRRGFTKYLSEVFSKLLTATELSLALKSNIIEMLILQTRYRRSNLINSRSQAALGI